MKVSHLLYVCINKILILGNLGHCSKQRQLWRKAHVSIVIARAAVPKDPEKNMNTAEDFMLLLVHVFVCSAVRQLQLEQPCSNLKELAKEEVRTEVRTTAERVIWWH